MPLGLFPRETSDILAGGLDTGTTPPPTPGFFTGVLGAAAQGVPKGLEEIQQAGATAVTSATAALVAPIRERLFQAGSMGMPVPETPPQIIASAPGDVEREMANASAHAVAQFTPNPHTTGLAGQTLNGLVSGITQFVAGASVAGPLGGAATVGAASGAQTRNELIAGGVDTDTANTLGTGAALFNGAASLLPGGVGKTLLERVGTGAGIQMIAGSSNRLLMHTVLEDAGYKDMAAQYRPFDGASLMADAVLGAGFGGLHHVMNLGEATDAARAVKDAVRVEQSAGGPAADPASRANIVDNHTIAAEALVAGRETPPTMGDVRIVPDTALEAAREASARGLDEAAADAGATPLDGVYEPTGAPEFDALLKDAQKLAEDIRSGTEKPAPPAEGEPVLDPATAELVGQAQEALARHPDLKIEGTDMPAELQRALEDVKAAKAEGDLHRIAAACFGRG